MRKARKSVPGSSRFRRFWGLAPGKAFLNHGSFGACPLTVLRYQENLRRQMEAEPVQFLWRHYEERLEPARRALAKYISARPQDVVFTPNATAGVNAVVRSLNLRSGDELLTTNQDYNACHNALTEVARQSGARVVSAPVPFPVRSAEDIIEAIVGAVTRRTRLAMIDHVTSGTALVFPIAEIIHALREKGVETLVDGAHAPGMIPLHLKRLQPAYYTGNLHKWVCAPKGAAFLWAREDLQGSLHPPVISHGYNTRRPGYSSFQDRFDWTGTFDPTAWFSVGEALGQMQRLLPGGWPDVMYSNWRLAITARRLLCSRLEVEPPCPESLLGSMATVPLPKRFQGRARGRGKLEREQVELYDRFGIEVPLFRIGKPETRYLRISVQLYNSLGDYHRLADAVAALS